jgi:hypothetical protein
MERMLDEMAHALDETCKHLESADQEAVSFFLPEKDLRSRIQDGILLVSTIVAEGVREGGRRGGDLVGDINDFLEGVDDYIEDRIDYIRGEGVAQVDEFVRHHIDRTLPPDIEAEEEFAGYKTEAKVTIPGGLVGAPASIYIEGGADVRLTRDLEGNIIVTIEGMAGGGLDESLKGDMGVAGGLRGRGKFEFKFDPNRQGDMTALLALLATTGGVAAVGLGGSGKPLAGLAGSGVLAVTGTSMVVAGEQVQFLDNLESYQLEGGLAGEFELEALDCKVAGSEEWMVGGGAERGEKGQLRPTVSMRRNLEVKGSISRTLGTPGVRAYDDGELGVAFEVEAVGKLNPPGSEITLSLEGQAGVSLVEADFEDPLADMGLEVDLKDVDSRKFEVKVQSDLPIERVMECYDSNTGNFDFSPLEGSIDVSVNEIVTHDNTLETEIGGAVSSQKLELGVSSGTYTGSKKKIHSII